MGGVCEVMRAQNVTHCPVTCSLDCYDTCTPTREPTESPTTQAPSWSPTELPSWSPTELPSWSPTKRRSLSPTESPSLFPTKFPSLSPTHLPPPLSSSPTQEPTDSGSGFDSGSGYSEGYDEGYAEGYDAGYGSGSNDGSGFDEATAAPTNSPTGSCEMTDDEEESCSKYYNEINDTDCSKRESMMASTCDEIRSNGTVCRVACSSECYDMTCAPTTEPTTAAPTTEAPTIKPTAIPTTLAPTRWCEMTEEEEESCSKYHSEISNSTNAVDRFATLSKACDEIKASGLHCPVTCSKECYLSFASVVPTLSPTQEPTSRDSSEPTPEPTTQCYDTTTESGNVWEDSDGYSCSWYSENNTAYNTSECQAYGSQSKNYDMTANEACCACGGGGATSASPTPEPTVKSLQCYDTTTESGNEWEDSDGYSCSWYSENNTAYNTSECQAYGSQSKNYDMTANEACCACGGGGNTSDAPTTGSGEESGFDDVTNAPSMYVPTTSTPTSVPTVPPTIPPTATTTPTSAPTKAPITTVPTVAPTVAPSPAPTQVPTEVPTTYAPSSLGETYMPSDAPTTYAPSGSPSVAPSSVPTPYISDSPTSYSPSGSPSYAPTPLEQDVISSETTNSPTAVTTSDSSEITESDESGFDQGSSTTSVQSPEPTAAPYDTDSNDHLVTVEMNHNVQIMHAPATSEPTLEPTARVTNYPKLQGDYYPAENYTTTTTTTTTTTSRIVEADRNYLAPTDLPGHTSLTQDY